MLETSSTKKERMSDLWKRMSADQKPMTRIKVREGEPVNIGFVNQYALHDSIPNKWFDWERRIDSEIMIIGQDWGPYSALLPYVESYEARKDLEGFDYEKFLFETFSSRTEKFIVKALEETYFERFGKTISKEDWEKFFLTVAIMFTRQGKHFRGNEFFDEKFGIEVSYPYLAEQIEIVQPKVIMPLGGIAFQMVDRYFDLGYAGKTITSVINDLGTEVIQVGDTKIIPNFHPAAHVSPAIQLEIWKRIWPYIEIL